ncbi:DNA-binding protein, partial [candidate division WWE3 bacterium CG08_land_8_20_14_0_20_41_10]
DNNPDKEGNIRDYSNVEQLVVLANLEGTNTELIREGLSQPDRLKKLNATAISQVKSLLDNPSVKKLAEKGAD